MTNYLDDLSGVLQGVALANYFEHLSGVLQSFGAAGIALLIVPVLITLLARDVPSATVTGTSPRASVSDTSVLPNAEAYCAATPTECLPFFGIAVSSITIRESRAAKNLPK